MNVVRRAATLSAGLLAVGLVTVLPINPAAAVQGSVPGNSASSWQTNGPVYALAYANGAVYVGGDFTSVRPPGNAAGTGEVTRNHLAAFNSSTGALITSFNPNVNNIVRSLAANPSGTTVYAAGDFTSVGSSTRTRLAAFNTSTYALSTSWAPSVDYRVSSITAGTNGVYIGGGFGHVNNVARLRIADLNPTTGAVVTSFNPTADNVIYSLALTPSGDKLYVAGAFANINGDTSYHGAAALNPTTGALLPLDARSVIPTTTDACSAAIKIVVTDATSAYFGSEGTGGGCFDGTFAANSSDGSLKWVSHCLGATQGIAVIGTLLYTGSHSHDCSGDQPGDPDAFSEVGWAKGLARHLLSRSTVNGHVGSWYPNTNGGVGGGLGPRVLATDGTQLFVGGEFTTVNNISQEGFTRFSPQASPVALPAKPAAPVAIARSGGKVSVFVQTPLDLDDTDLIVRLYRDGGTTPIATLPEHSLFWRQPVAGFEDDGLAVGSKHTYSVDVVAASGDAASPKATSASVTVVSTAPAYQSAVEANSPSLYWRLGEAAGPVAADASGSLNGGTVAGGVTFNQAGAIAGNTAAKFDGSTGYVASEISQPAPSTYSVEAWVKTTSTSGGRIIGFGDSRGGLDFSGNPANSNNYDKQLYMTNDGHVIFGVYTGGTNILTSSAALNDGSWHHLVGTQGSGGMALYVDGVRVAKNGQTSNQQFDGFWRVGGDNLNGWPSQPSSNYFAGTIDDAAVYPAALSATSVAAHYSASGRTAAALALPTDSYGAAVVADSPDTFWRLDEASGTTATDSSGNGNNGVETSSGITQGATGAIGGFGQAETFDGSTGNLASATSSTVGSYATELWFKTTTTAGGKLIGFGDQQTGNSGSYDKQVYLTNDGTLVFGVYNNGFDTLSSASGLNDGAWHQVVAEQDSTGMKLYVDDKLAGSNTVTGNQSYQGYWRVGGDNLNAWPNQPTSSFFAGTLDEVAIYDNALSQSDVDSHWAASGR